MEHKETLIIGLSGPSAVGKGYCKEEIKKHFQKIFIEPTVATTRPKRSNDGLDRLSGLSLETFNELRDKGEIIFTHQPFGDSGDWYGFLSSSIDCSSKNILTEVHPDNIIPFKERYPGRVTLVGLVAGSEYLESNIRQRSTETENEIQTRLHSSIAEAESLRNFKKLGLIDFLIEVNHQNRGELSPIIINLIDQIINHE